MAGYQYRDSGKLRMEDNQPSSLLFLSLTKGRCGRNLEQGNEMGQHLLVYQFVCSFFSF